MWFFLFKNVLFQPDYSRIRERDLNLHGVFLKIGNLSHILILMPKTYWMLNTPKKKRVKNNFLALYILMIEWLQSDPRHVNVLHVLVYFNLPKSKGLLYVL